MIVFTQSRMRSNDRISIKSTMGANIAVLAYDDPGSELSRWVNECSLSDGCHDSASFVIESLGEDGLDWFCRVTTVSPGASSERVTPL